MPKSAAGTRRAPSALAGDGLFSSREAPFSIGPPPGGLFTGPFRHLKTPRVGAPAKTRDL